MVDRSETQGQCAPSEQSAESGRAPEALVRLDGVSHWYREGQRRHTVLAGADLQVQRGTAVALLGRSGSGKTTLLNLVAGIDRPARGSIRVAGRDIVQLKEPDRTLFRRRSIGFIYQFFNLIPTLTVAENVSLPMELNRWPRQEIRERTASILQEVGLATRAHEFPDQLSGGEQQRVAIARGLVHEPELVLADEPTGNLDAESGGQVLHLLQRMLGSPGRTLILVTHSLQVARACDRILTLELGRLCPPDEETAW